MFGKKDPAGDDVFLRLDATNGPLTGTLGITVPIAQEALTIGGSWNSSGNALIDVNYINTGGFFQSSSALKITALAAGAVNGPIGVDIFGSDNGGNAGRGIRVTNSTNSSYLGFLYEGNVGGNTAQRGFSANIPGIGFQSNNALVNSFESTLVDADGTKRHFSADTTSIGEVAFIDDFGNFYKAGSILDYKFATGFLNNQCRFSDDMTGANWTSSGVTITPNALDGPDGPPAVVDQLFGALSSSTMSLSLPDIGASAGKTVTASFWYRHIFDSGEISRLKFFSTNETETGKNLPSGSGAENKWFFITHTFTFTGASTGNIGLQIKSANNHTYAIAGMRVVEGQFVRGYVPTYGAAVGPGSGVSVADLLYLSSSQGSTREINREGVTQGADNRLEFEGPAGVFQMAVAPNGQDFILDTVTGSKIGTAPTEKLGFWNAAPIVQPAVTGSRAGNAALTSLLSQLAATGLVVDNTTA